MKILLDTDIGYGTDADDAVALAYLLRQPECELLGITTVGLHADWRAEMADVICHRLGKPEIPIAAGADQPLFSDQYWQENPIRPWPGDGCLKPSGTYQTNQALELMRQVIRENPNEITLITIGQFTNLATLLLADPETAGLLKEVVSMGGAMEYPPGQPRGECNVILDPVAAGIVFQRLGEQFTLVPIDVVRGMPLEAEQLAQIFDNDESMDALREACGGWKKTKGKNHVGLADPATVALVFDQSLAVTEKGTAGLHLYDHPLPEGQAFDNDAMTGATYFEKAPDGPHRVVRKIHKERMHEHLMRVLTANS